MQEVLPLLQPQMPPEMVLSLGAFMHEMAALSHKLNQLNPGLTPFQSITWQTHSRPMSLAYVPHVKRDTGSVQQILP